MSTDTAEAIYNKAAKFELIRDFDNAFRHYLSAADAFLHRSRLASSSATEKDKASWKSSAGKALQRAEKIKEYTTNQSARRATDSSAAVSSLAPASVNAFSEEQQYYVLKKGSIVNGLSFELWDNPIHKSSSGELFEDPDGQPALSSEQRSADPIWLRLDYTPTPYTDQEPSRQNIVRIQPQGRLLPTEILQHIVTDCSVSASISVCLRHAGQFSSTIAESALYSSSLKGQYYSKFLFNGAWRRIVIDNKLPYHPETGKLLCLSTTALSQEGRDTAWPSLLEKAYMKLMGGYDFPGSTSSTDLHALAGWIPEHIEIKSPSFERERTWSRIDNGFTSGHCVLTIGTGSDHNSTPVWNTVELLPSHSYAVIGISNKNDRILTVIDSRLNIHEEKEAALLQIPWSDMLDVFDSLYISWDPKFWNDSVVFHGMWKSKSTGVESWNQSHLRLQFNGPPASAKTRNDQEIWVLLTRHIIDTRRASEYTALHVQVEDDDAGLFAGARGAAGMQKVAKKAEYTNSTHILARVQIYSTQSTGALSIFTSYVGNFDSVGYTVTAYSKLPIKLRWDQTVHKAPFTEKIASAFANRTAGGNFTYPTYMINPQYHLQIFPTKASQSRDVMKANVTLTLQADRNVPVNVTVVWSQGERKFELEQKDIVGNSGPYSYGLARVGKDLPVGDYTVIISSFHPSDQIGPFSLSVESSNRLVIKPIAQEGAGMYFKTIRGAWDEKTAAGSPGFNNYASNPIFEMHIPSLSDVQVRLQLERPATSISLNVSIYEANVHLSLGRNVCTSGGYDDAVSGCKTPQVVLAAGKYFLVPSTHSPGLHASFRLIVYTNTAGTTITRKSL